MRPNLQYLLRQATLVSLVTLTMILLLPLKAKALGTGGLSIQVSPSPLVLSFDPGESRTVQIAIHNFETHSETLRPLLTGFTMSNDSQQISFNTAPPEIASWVKFDTPQITVAPGSDQRLGITYSIPQNAGFSYSAAIVLERSQKVVPQPGTTALEASIATFNLITVNRPGAKETLTIDSFDLDKAKYEFLPVTFSLKTKNTGNIIGRPSGNIFIQRSVNDDSPIAVLPINEAAGYVLPDKSRTFTTTWNGGFPAFVTTQASTGDRPSTRLVWDWREISHMRFGRYVAKAVVVYNDGKRDTSLIATQSFWVIPWRLIGILLLIAIVLLAGLAAIGLLIYKLIRKARRRA